MNLENENGEITWDIKGFKAFSDLAMTFFPEYSNIVPEARIMWISCWVVRVTKTEAETAAMVETAVRAATLPEGMMETRHRTRQFKTVNYTWRGDFSPAMFFSLI